MCSGRLGIDWVLDSVINEVIVKMKAMEEELVPKGQFTLNLKPQPLVFTFNNLNGEPIGVLKDVDGKLCFTGNVDEAAQLFFDAIVCKYNK